MVKISKVKSVKAILAQKALNSSCHDDSLW